MKHFRSAFIALLVALYATAAHAQEATYTNPVVAGDYPDPSIIRVGQDYWATMTSGEWAPFFPILRSPDLINWKIVSAVFKHRPRWTASNFWAPEIAQDRGRYFIYYTARKKAGPLCVAVATADRPEGPYTDHGPLVCQAIGSIDAFATRDENNRLYLIWKEDGNSRNRPTPLWAQQLSDDGTKLVGKKKELMRNDAKWEAHVIEGAFVLRREGWFYMFYSGNACCGRECNYALGVARSRTLLGPYEKSANNPILSGNEEWKCPGHGSIVSDERGRTFMLYHAYKRSSDSVHLGREALLDEITWEADGWPAINKGKGPSTQTPAPPGFKAHVTDSSFFDDFTSRTLQAGWQWPQRNPPSARFDNQGRLILSANGKPGKRVIETLIAQPTRSGDYVATTVVDAGSLRSGAQAGLAAIQDEENGVGIRVAKNNLSVWKRENSINRIIASVATPRATSVHLRISASGGSTFSFAVSSDGRDWTEVVDKLNASYLEAIRIALTCGGAKGASAKFDWLRVTPARSASN